MSTKKSLSRIFSVFNIVLFLLVPTISAMVVTHVRADAIRYAKPDGTGDCNSWATACTLATALTGASSGDEIWAAAGTYKPTTTGPEPRAATFELKDGVAIYGGFSAVGGETARDQRNWMSNRTYLSGDLNSDDGDSFLNNNDNAFHVVTASSGVGSTATLDGFTIMAGNADISDTADGNGGGMVISYASPTLGNLTFSDNYAYDSGGGIQNDHGSPTLTNVTFTNNWADWAGGMNIFAGNPVLTDVTFATNTAASGAGGILVWVGSISTLTNVTFSGNSADQGGGLVVWVTDTDNSTATLTNVTFSGNSALSGNGGGMLIHGGTPQIRNTIFWNNTATGSGNAIYNEEGTGIPGSMANPSVSDSVIQGGCPTGSTCTNIISNDPKLGSIGDYGGFTQTIPILLPDSSAIDAGNDSVCPAMDQRGINRPQGAHCDIGAFEVVDNPPTNIILSKSSVAENSAINTVVGTLSSTDPDAGNTFTYSLVTGSGDTDNASFNISGASLRTSAVLNFETKASYTVRIRTTDQGGLFFEKAFTITVTNINEIIYLPLIHR